MYILKMLFLKIFAMGFFFSLFLERLENVNIFHFYFKERNLDYVIA